MCRHILVLVVWVFTCGSLMAQQFVAHVQKFDVNDGMSSCHMNDGMQDSKGFLWFTTDYGLNRFDGREFKVYTKEENGLPHNNVLLIAEDYRGMMWIAGGNRGEIDLGHAILNPETDQILSLAEYLGGPPPFNPRFTVTRQSKLGKVTLMEFFPGKGGLAFYVFDGAGLRRIGRVKGDDPHIRNKLWHDFYALPGDEYVLRTTEMDQNNSQFVHFDRNGRFLRTWACPPSHPLTISIRPNETGLCVYCAGAVGNRWQVQAFFNGMTSQQQDISILPEWGERIGAGYGLICSWAQDTLRVFDSIGKLLDRLHVPLELNYEYHGMIHIDRDHNIWIADSERLYCISLVPKIFQAEFRNPGNPTRFRGITRSADGTTFVSEYMRAWERPPNGKWRQFHAGHHNPLGLLVDASEGYRRVWIGTESAVLGCYHPGDGSYREYPVVPKAQGRNATLVWMPYRAADGTIWAGTNAGLYRVDPQLGKLVPFQEEESELGNSTVYAFHSNASGTWLCTSAGLFLMDLKAQRILAHYGPGASGDRYLPAEHIAHLYEDPDGSFWLATKGSGLVHWNPRGPTSKIYTPRSAGLSHNVLYAVYGDEADNLWITSSNGLMRFSKDNGFVQAFYEEDGLPHNEFNTISHFQAPDGHLYFGGQNGFVHFHPKEYNRTPKDFPLYLTAVKLQEKSTDSLRLITQAVEQTSTITLAPSDKAVIVRYTLLDYHNSQKHQYSYKIVGYDQNWNYLAGNELRIGSLPYGRYDLLLRAKAASGGKWVDYPGPITLVVLRPLYLRWWFILVCALAFLGLVFAGFAWRIRSLSRRKRELERQVEERTATIAADKKIIEADKQHIEAQAEELKTLDRLKSQFFANISHELRTPLTLILGPLASILDHPEQMEKENVRKQLLVMQRNGKSLLQLVEEILDLSRMDAKKLELHLEPTPVRLFFEQVEALFEPQFFNQQIHFEAVYLLSTDSLSVMMDRKKMEKVVNNFLANALKFTPKGGMIRLVVEEMDTFLRIMVRDNGKGIHPGDLPHVFERYFQTKQVQTKSNSGGTGIGLALVHDFAVLMEGRTYVESRLGEGATFYFELSKQVGGRNLEMQAEPAAALEEDYPIENIGTDFTVLVVEDNADMRTYVMGLLQPHFQEVVSAQNGGEALELLALHGKGISLIVSDIMMPEIDGLTLLRRVKAHAEWQQIPMVMLTALVEDRDRLDALLLGVDDYLTKPFSPPELIVRAKNLLYNYQQRHLWQGSGTEVPETEGAAEDVEPQSPPLREAELATLHRIQEFVRSCIPGNIPDVSALADKLAISPRQLTRQLQRLTGLTPGRYIREVQLQVARTQLESGTALSVKEVCFNAGFEQASTFSALFKKRFGVAPSAYMAVEKSPLTRQP